jgi:hypothetical protein
MELRRQHKAQINSKIREHKRKMAMLLSRHEEELEKIQHEQLRIMDGENIINTVPHFKYNLSLLF